MADRSTCSAVAAVRWPGSPGCRCTPTTWRPSSRTNRRRPGHCQTTPRRRTGRSWRAGGLPGQGCGAGMATFIGLTMWPGEFTDAYFAQPAPYPAVFGMSTEDDGRRDDALLSERAVTVTTHEYDLDAIKTAPTRVVLGVGEETGTTVTARTARRWPGASGRSVTSPATTAVSWAAARRTRTPASRSSSGSRFARCSTRPVDSVEPARQHEESDHRQPDRPVDHAGQRVGEVVGAQVQPGDQVRSGSTSSTTATHRAARKYVQTRTSARPADEGRGDVARGVAGVRHQSGVEELTGGRSRGMSSVPKKLKPPMPASTARRR